MGNNVFSRPESRPRVVSPQWGCANLAQLVEHFIRNERVVGSIPIVGSKLCSYPVLPRP